MQVSTKTSPAIDPLKEARQRLQRQEKRLAMALLEGQKGAARDAAVAEIAASIAALKATIEQFEAASDGER